MKCFSFYVEITHINILKASFYLFMFYLGLGLGDFLLLLKTLNWLWETTG